MKIIVTSFLGDHNCECETPVAEQLFNKLTGKTKAPLPASLKTVGHVVPFNF